MSQVSIKIEKPTMSAEELTQFRVQVCRMDQKQFGALMGVTPQAIQLWETSQRRVPETTVRLIRMFRKYPEIMENF